MADESKRYSDVIDRRRFVELTGVAGAAALAGCGGDGEATDEPTDTEPSDDDDDDGDGATETDTATATQGDQVYDQTYKDFTNSVPADFQFNVSNPSNMSQIAWQDLFDRLAAFDFASGEFIPYLATDWNLSGTTFEISIREGVTWENGNDLTAEDVVTRFQIAVTQGGAITDLVDGIDSISAADDYTVQVELSSEQNPQIVRHQLLGARVYTETDKYSEYVGDQEALTQFADQDPISCGPWTLASAGQQQFVLERRDEDAHPDVENINFTQKTYTFLDGNQAAQQALTQLNLDGAWSLFSPPEVVADYPDPVVESRPPAKWGFGITPNHDDEYVGQREVRQAMMEAINRDQVIANAGPRTKATPQIATAIAVDDQQRWLGDNIDSYTGYSKGSSNVERADQLMDEAGFSKDGGMYKDSNGNNIRIPLIVPSAWTDWVAATQTIVDQLSAAGFDAVVDGQPFGTIAGNIWTNRENFRTAAFWWLPGGGSTAFPYFPLEHQLVHGADSIDYGYAGHNEESITVPGMDGGETTVNPSEQLSTLASTTDADTSQSIVQELAWVANQDLPMLPIAEKLEQSFVTDDEWFAPEEGSDAYQVKWSGVWLPRTGQYGADPN